MDDFDPEQLIGGIQPAAVDPPTWEQYWEYVRDPWLLAAKHVAELSPRGKDLLSWYLDWDADGVDDVPTLNWGLLANEVDKRSDFSSTERALGRAAAALANGSGQVDFRALSIAGYLSEILAVIAQAEAAVGAQVPLDH